MEKRTWFITGTSRGFGREWALAALARGDRVVGTARDARTMRDIAARHGTDRFLALPLDVTDRTAVFDTVSQAHDHFGELDIIVNNAGYGQFGAVEELSEEEVRDQIETNLFGAIWVTQAALPYLRPRGRGHILQISSMAGICAFTELGMYHASKFALEGISQSLALEVKDFGLHVTLVEPGIFATEWSGTSARWTKPIDAYAPMHEAGDLRRVNNVKADPAATSAALMRVVDADSPPLRVFFGAAPLAIAEAEYERRLATWREWQSVAELAQTPEHTGSAA